MQRKSDNKLFFFSDFFYHILTQSLSLLALTACIEKKSSFSSLAYWPSAYCEKGPEIDRDCVAIENAELRRQCLMAQYDSYWGCYRKVQWNLKDKQLDEKTKILVSKINSKKDENLTSYNTSLASNLAALQTLTRINAEFLPSLRPLSEESAVLLEKYTNENRLKLEKTMTDISNIYRSAETTDVLSLWLLVGELEKIRGTEQTTARQFIDQSQLIAEKLRSIRISYESKVAPVRNTLIKLGIDDGFLEFSQLAEIIASIRINSVNTEQTIEQKIDTLKTSLINKINSIYAQQVPVESRKKMSQAKKILLSSDNVSLINREIKDALTDSTPNTTNNLHPLGEKYRKFIRLKNKLKECASLGAELEWMRTGCNRLAKYANTISNHLSSIIISEAKLNINFIKEKKPEHCRNLCKQFDNFIELKRFEDAIEMHDIIVDLVTYEE